MRTTLLVLLFAPFLLSACTDQLLTSAPEALLSTGDAGTVDYAPIILEGGAGSATVIADNGLIFGQVGDGISGYPAVRWAASEGGVSGPEKLGVLPHPLDDAHQQRPTAMNSDGMVVGTAISNRHIAAWVYSDQFGMQLLPWFLGNTFHSEANGINDLGISVGYIVFAVRDSDGTIIDRLSRGAVWPNTRDEPILLPPLDGHDWSFAGTINNGGVVAGISRLTDDDGLVIEQIGVTWLLGGEGEVTGPNPLEPGFIPVRVNDASDIAGYQWRATGGAEPLLMRGGSVLALAPLNTKEDYGFARGIGEVGTDGVVRIVGDSGSRPALWTIDAFDVVRGPTDLGLPKGRFESAQVWSVNAQGWIVGSSMPRTGGNRPVLWIPQQSDGGDDGGGDCNPHPRTGKCRS
jgi:hypothetical protein